MRILNKISLVLFVGLVICCAGFVIMRSHVVLNRYTDSWWHVAVADEYVNTGIFAKDPFIKDAPYKFAQFGLMDFCNAIICEVTGRDCKIVFPWCVAGSAVLFLVGAFMSGYWINRNMVSGLVSAFAWMLLYPGQTIINLGFPFATAVALLGFLFVSFFGNHDSEISWIGYLWRGLLLGIIFDMHVFVGAVGCVMAGVWLVRAVWRNGNLTVQNIKGAVSFGVAFLLVAWRWIIMQMSLRGVLAVNNAHVRDALPLDVGMLMIVLALIVILVLVWVFAGRRILFISLVAYGVGLLIVAVPPLNNIIMKHTSWYMAHRILWLFPVGIVFAYAFEFIMSGKWRGGLLVRKILILLIAVGVLLPAGRTWAMKQLFLARTDEYNVHEFGYLEKLAELSLVGKTVLSDPVTSYYLRGMTGAYVCTVIPGEGSPALDYVVLNEDVRNALISGKSVDNIDAVVLDIKNGATEHFMGLGVEEVIDVWEESGWSVVFGNGDVIVLKK